MPQGADLAISVAPDLTWLYTNRAHALMFLGRAGEARTIYLDHRGEKTQGDKIWETVVKEDFAVLRKAGLANPLMDEIEKDSPRGNEGARMGVGEIQGVRIGS